MGAKNLNLESSWSTWRLFSFATLLAFVVSFAFAVCQPDNAFFLNLFVGGPLLFVLSIVLLVYALKRKKWQISMLALAVVWLVSYVFFAYQRQIRTAVRWSLWSHQYKSALLTQQTSSEAELKHMVLDDWGWGGINNTMYLVFDPTDSLSSAASTPQSGEFAGIPCRVPKVRRLENQWYAVTFYTDQDWDHCNPSGAAR
jgi:hypothetical protein